MTRQRVFPLSPSHIGACLNRVAVGAFRAMECVNRGAFDCFTVVVCINRTAFLCPWVGAYCIRPTNVPPKEGESPAIGRGQAFAIHGMAFCGAYAIRPYRDSRKMIAFGACSAVLPKKIGCLWGRLWGGRWKMWRVFMPLGRNYPAQKVRGVCCFKKDATFAAVTTAVVDIFLK